MTILDAGVWTPEAFAEMARELAEAQGVVPTLAQIVSRALDLVPCDCAAALVADEITSRPARLAASTDTELTGIVAEIAGAAGTSPGWSAYASGAAVHVPDLTAEERFGSYPAEMVGRTPIRSVLSYGLRVHERTLGVLSLYAYEANAFDAAAVSRGAVLADHAVIAIQAEAERDRADNLQVALRSSRTISVALGILVERYRVTPDQAFDLLRTVSQRTQRKVIDLAATLVETGRLPSVPLPVRRGR